MNRYFKIKSLKERWHYRKRRWPSPNLQKSPRQNRYVGFLDLLGFGKQIEQNLDSALGTYDQIFSRFRELWPSVYRSVEISIVSDSILVTSTNLHEIVLACNHIQHLSLFQDTLVRGGIAHGVHIEARHKQNYYVVSPALVRAVCLEKTVHYPCVVLDPAIIVPISFYPRPGMHPLERLLFFYDSKWIVSPFTKYWFQSARTRVSMMKSDHQEHAPKYEWFLGLCDAILAGDWLVPTNLRKEHDS